MDTGDLAVQDAQSRSVPSGEEVRVHLENLLASADFEASDRRRSFLRFIVDETLAGRAGQLKGYTVAIAVFDRDETFDSQTDPVVRLEARRLRRDLDSYYMGPGRHDSVRISVPKGSYVPKFERQEPPPGNTDDGQPAQTRPAATDGEPDIPVAVAAEARAAPPRFRALGIVAAAALVLIGAAIWVLTAERETAGPPLRSSGPAVVVLPFKSLAPGENGAYLAAGIGQDLIGNLMRFPGFRLYTLPRGFDPGREDQPVELGRELGVDYVVTGSVRADAGQARVATQLIDAGTAEVLWTGTYDRPLSPEAFIGVQSELAGDIATALGQPYGAVNTDLETRALSPAVSNLQSYICVLRAYDYRRNFSKAEYGPVLACLEAAVRRDPGYADAWAMLGWLHLDAGRYEFSGAENVQSEYESALQAATRGLELEPDNTLALKSLSSIYHYIGRFDDAERLARRAAELNPHDPDTLAQLGWRLAARGNFEEGIPLLEKAIERTANPPGWYYHLVAIDLYLKGEYAQMLEVTGLSREDSSHFNQALVAIAGGALDDSEVASAALRNLPQEGPLGRSLTEFLRRHGATDEIVDALEAGLARARQVASAPHQLAAED